MKPYKLIRSRRRTIALMIAADATLVVRAPAHTPLDTIEQFVGKSRMVPEPKHWKVAKDGGRFDARAGATITPRAVVKAVGAALDYFARNRAALLAEKAAPNQETPP